MIFLAILSMLAGGEDQSSPARFAGNPAEFFGVDNYPPDARRARQQGRVIVDIAIDADGRPTGCVVTTTAWPSLDQKTCAIAMTQIRYIAARDSAGKPTAGKLPLAVRWQLDEELFPTAPIEVTKEKSPDSVLEVALEIDEKGRVASCSIVRATPDMKSDPCVPYPVGLQIAPGFVRNGKPIRAIMRQKHMMTTEFLP